MRSYRIRDEIAWVDAEDGERPENIVWISRLDNGQLFELTGSGWLLWGMLADGLTDTEAILTEIAELEMTVDFGESGLDGFLEALVAQGLLEVREG